MDFIKMTNTSLLRIKKLCRSLDSMGVDDSILSTVITESIVAVLDDAVIIPSADEFDICGF
jgi:hypothetical protein